MAWTPYLVINYIGIFNRSLITPLFTIWGSLFAKANAIYNPIVYGIRYVFYNQINIIINEIILIIYFVSISYTVTQNIEQR